MRATVLPRKVNQRGFMRGKTSKRVTEMKKKATGFAFNIPPLNGCKQDMFDAVFVQALKH